MKNATFGRLSIALTTAFTILSASTTTFAATDFLPSPGIFTQDVPAAADSPLGAAQYFHIFARQANLYAHTDGNIATNALNAQVNFGTEIHSGGIPIDISYLQTISNIQSSSFVSATASRRNKVVLGPTVPAWLQDNNQQPGVFILQHESKMGHLQATELFRDGSQPYLSIPDTLQQTATQGQIWSEQLQTPGVRKDFTDGNHRLVTVPTATAEPNYAITLRKTDVAGNHLTGAQFALYKTGTTTPLRTQLTTDATGKLSINGLTDSGDYYFVETTAPAGFVRDQTPQHVTVTTANNLNSSPGITFVKLDGHDLAADTPLTIQKLSSTGPFVVVNVDLHGQSSLTVRSQIKLIIDGKERVNHESDSYGDAKILWNFYNGGSKPNIKINAPFQGSILAPGGQILANQNVDGSLIADTVTVAAETHRWDPQITTSVQSAPAELTVVNQRQSALRTISGKKTWRDHGDAQHLRPRAITLLLHRNGRVIAKTQARATTGWCYSFTSLPLHDSLGKNYQYSVSEVSVPGYSSKQSGFDFTNTLHTTAKPILPATPKPSASHNVNSKASTVYKPAATKSRSTKRSHPQSVFPQTGDASQRFLLSSGILLLLTLTSVALWRLKH